MSKNKGVAEKHAHDTSSAANQSLLQVQTKYRVLTQYFMSYYKQAPAEKPQEPHNPCESIAKYNSVIACTEL